MIEYDFKVIQPVDIDLLLSFDLEILTQQFADSEELMFASWSSRARRESLEHYAKLGWSFKAVDAKQQLQGFILAQPLLFLSGQTQSLWVECVCVKNIEVQHLLLDLSYRLAREKHLQCVYYPKHLPVKVGPNSALSNIWEEAPSIVSLVKK